MGPHASKDSQTHRSGSCHRIARPVPPGRFRGRLRPCRRCRSGLSFASFFRDLRKAMQACQILSASLRCREKDSPISSARIPPRFRRGVSRVVSSVPVFNQYVPPCRRFSMISLQLRGRESMCAAPAHHGASPRAGLAVLQAYQVAWDVPCGSSRQDLATVERAVVRNASDAYTFSSAR